jgi:hypothetical protein
MAVQPAREAGAYVIGTGRAAHREAAIKFGANEFVDLNNEPFENIGQVEFLMPSAAISRSVLWA